MIELRGRSLTRTRWLSLIAAGGLIGSAFAYDAADPGAIVGLAVIPDTVRVEAGDSTALSAVLIHESGRTSPADDVAWLSSHPEVAGVAASGRVHAAAPGRARVVAARGELVGAALVLVPGWFGVDSLPEARRAGHVAAINGELYYAGGNAGIGESYVSDTYVYLPEVDRWISREGALPTPRDQGSTAVWGDRIFVIGGVNPLAPNNGLSRLFANEGFLRQAGRWLAYEPLPRPRGGARADTLGGEIYVVGGGPSGVETLSLVDIYDPTTDSWASAPPLPTARQTVGIGSIGGRLFVVGGEVAAPTRAASGVLEIFDPKSGFWTSGPAMPTPRFVVASCVHDGRLWVFGGSTGDGPLDVAEVFDPETSEWSTLAPMPVARREARAAAVGGVIYVAGGVVARGITARVDGFIP